MFDFWITLFCIIITIGFYVLANKIHKKFPSPLTIPIFIATASVISVLLLFNISYEQYTFAKELMTFLLGPATVALAVPLYRQRNVIFTHVFPIFIGIFGGTITTIFVAIYMAIGFGLTEQMVRSFSVKSITIPIANEVAPIIAADQSLVLAFVMITGICGAMFGSFFMNIGRIQHPIARGLGFGTISHGIGTSQAVKEGELAGASSSVAMGLAAIITSLILPWMIPLLF